VCGVLTLVVFSALLLGAVQPAHGQTETVLYSFCARPNCTDGAGPSWVTPVFDGEGNLYGTTLVGGAYSCNHGGCGTVFELTPSGTETILHSFDDNGTDGHSSWGGVFLDNEGTLYGTTLLGGEYICPQGSGTVFELTPSGTETILHSFDRCETDGFWPNPGLVRDAEGNIYGTTSAGGAYSYGTVFKVTPSGTETILHSFDPNGTDGWVPAAGLVIDKKGNLYGTTVNGGAYNGGTVFKLTPSGKETILWSFGNGTDGSHPYAGLVFDKKRNLYGTTEEGGVYSCPYGYTCGTVFKLTPSGMETILYSFGVSGDGYAPVAGLLLDKKGNLYGTTADGGSYSREGYGCALYGCGTVFKLTPSGTETILHSFGASGDGYQLNGGLVFDKKGNLYGATYRGGAYCAPYGCGTVFKVTP
jgi:uncharacterized repeat protein (TIGR03803 family)